MRDGAVPVSAPIDFLLDLSPKSMVTSRTAGALAGGETSMAKVTVPPATGSSGLAVTATGMAGAGSTSTAIDEVAA